MDAGTATLISTLVTALPSIAPVVLFLFVAYRLDTRIAKNRETTEHVEKSLNDIQHSIKELHRELINLKIETAVVDTALHHLTDRVNRSGVNGKHLHKHVE